MTTSAPGPARLAPLPRRATGPAVALLLLLLAPRAAGAGDADKGRAKAAVACMPCHGEAGISAVPDAPHLAGQPEPYLAAQLKLYRSGKRLHEAMNQMAKGLTDAEIADLAAWYATIEVHAEVKGK